MAGAAKTAYKTGQTSGATHALVGAGNMGGALLAGWLKTRGKAALRPDEILIIDPKPGQAAQKALSLGSSYATALTRGAASGLELCLLAIKPQMFEELAPAIAKALPSQTMIVSIMAGISIAQMQSAFGERPIVRAMPNMPAAAGRGITAYVANTQTQSAQKKLAAARLKAGGKVVALTDERQIDMVTALSGSGPAYVFHLAETMAAAGESIGLPADLAKILADETVYGAGAMLRGSKANAQDLRRAVTSPGGTTAAALEVLMAEDGLAPMMRKAVKAAHARARALGQSQ